jgi:hypothetical protein
MRSFHAAMLAFALAVPFPSMAQSAATVVGGSGTNAQDTNPPAPKKKGGLFGKVKGIAKNKVVKQVAKTAACTMLPGGQMIVGALDAAETKNVAGAASTAVTGGGSCMPGMAGMAAPAGPGAAGIGAAGVDALGAVAAGVPGQPSTGMPGMAISPDQLKQMQEQYGKMGMDTARLRAMQQMMAGMPGASPAEAAPPSAPEPASGAPALSREKGRMVVRNLPWSPGSETLRPGGEPMFGMAMQEVGLAIKATVKRHKIEARVEEQGGKAQTRLLSQKRGAAVLAALTARGVPADRLTVAEGKSDKDPRIIVSEDK